jgi:hypothetical protein
MKSTIERLANAYCEPVTKEDWSALGFENVPKFSVKGQRVIYATKDTDERFAKDMDLKDSRGEWLTDKISCAQFVDLIYDRIADWRLLEDGWTTYGHVEVDTAYEYRCNNDALLTYVPYGEGVAEFHAWPTDIDGETSAPSVPFCGIKNYTQLLNLIECLKQ